MHWGIHIFSACYNWWLWVESYSTASSSLLLMVWQWNDLGFVALKRNLRTLGMRDQSWRYAIHIKVVVRDRLWLVIVVSHVSVIIVNILRIHLSHLWLLMILNHINAVKLLRLHSFKPWCGSNTKFRLEGRTLFVRWVQATICCRAITLWYHSCRRHLGTLGMHLLLQLLVLLLIIELLGIFSWPLAVVEYHHLRGSAFGYLLLHPILLLTNVGRDLDLFSSLWSRVRTDILRCLLSRLSSWPCQDSTWGYYLLLR